MEKEKLEKLKGILHELVVAISYSQDAGYFFLNRIEEEIEEL